MSMRPSEVRYWAAIALWLGLALAACGGRVEAEPEEARDAGPGDGGPDAPPDASPLVCSSGEHVCDGACVAEGPRSCGAACAVCPDGPDGGHPTCTEGVCGFTCPGDDEPCGDTCCPTRIAGGGAHSCFLRQGVIRCWGWNGNGQLGDGTTNNALTAVTVQGLPRRAVDIAAGYAHTCALLDDGTIYCWGENATGELGDGTTADRSLPVRTSPLADGTALGASNRTSCAIADQLVRCWGSAPAVSKDVQVRPTIVSGLAKLEGRALAVGGFHACVLTSAGGVRCWGTGESGELGDGLLRSSPTPVTVKGLSGVTDVASGLHHTCAVAGAGGSVWCWGLVPGGLGTEVKSPAPLSIAGLDEPIAEVAAGSLHTCVRTAGGAVQCWGDPSSSRLGNPTAKGGLEPTDVVDLPAKVTRIAAGHEHTCVLLEDKGVACWGANSRGQLGDGSTMNRPGAVAVLGL